MKAVSHHAPYDRYSVAYPQMGIMYLAEVAWTVPRTARFHSHREIQVLCVLDGEMGMEMNGRRHESGAGTCYIIPARKQHLVYQQQGQPRVGFLDLRLMAEPACTMAGFLTGLDVACARMDKRKLRDGAATLRQVLSVSSTSRAARLQAILWQIFTALQTDDRPLRDDSAGLDAGILKLRCAENFMKERLAQPFTIEEAAAAAGISRSQLTRLFMRHLGAGPAERLRQLRIEKARHLMASSTLTVKEVAHVCGFVCPNHFCRVFLNMAGLTPTAYRLSKFAD